MTYVLLIACLVAVAFAVYQLSEANHWREYAFEAKQESESNRTQLEESRRAVVQLEAESGKHREIAEIQLRLLTQTQQQLEEKFRSVAAEALQNNSQMFLDRTRDQMQQVVEPVNQSLKRFEEQVRALEVSREGAYQGLSTQVQGLMQLQDRVRQSADDLKTALRSPSQRGRWGEIQLRRVVELAGMLEHCDFLEQKTLFGETVQRPDLIVHLPNECHVVIDAKVSLEAYLRAVECQDEKERLRCLKEHAAQVRTHLRALSAKAYWERLPCSPEFVVAFLPLESLFSAALEHDPSLIETGVSGKVLIATPTTLISLLLTVAHGWRQQALSENAERVRALGVDLYSRLLTMNQHFQKLGEAIAKTVGTYNETLGSMERMVLPGARKFKELQSNSAKDLAEVEPIDRSPRAIDASKWAVNS